MWPEDSEEAALRSEAGSWSHSGEGRFEHVKAWGTVWVQVWDQGCVQCLAALPQALVGAQHLLVCLPWEKQEGPC